MAELKWYGARVAAKMLAATELGVDATMAAAVADARDDHPLYPPPSAPYERYHTRTGFETNSIRILRAGEPEGATIAGQWGADNAVALYLEIGTSVEGPRAMERVIAAGGNMDLIAPPIGPLMAPRPFLRPAADREYPLLGARIGAAFRGEQLP